MVILLQTNLISAYPIYDKIKNLASNLWRIMKVILFQEHYNSRWEGLQVPAVEKHRFISLILIEQLMFFVNTLLWHEKRQEKSWVLRNDSKLSSIEKLIRFVRLMWTRRRFRLWCMFYVTCGLNRFWANLLKNLFQHFEIFFYIILLVHILNYIGTNFWNEVGG